jgi:outer membrane murein-binding lipoprotein Lpp
MRFSCCIPVANLIQLRPREDGHANRMLGFALVCHRDYSLINNPEGDLFMKSAIVVKLAAAAVVTVLAGCTDLKPLQAQVDDLKGQVSRLQSDLASAKSASDSANSTAQSANQAASGAQSTANQALAAAQASQSCCDSTNEKIDRMFRRSISK